MSDNGQSVAGLLMQAAPTRGRASALARYGIAVAVAGLAVLLRLVLTPLWGRELPLILFFPAVMVSAWLGGFWSGMLTTLLCAAAADYFWMSPSPVGFLTLSHFGDVVGLSIFIGIGAVISGLNETWRRSVRERAALLDAERAARVDTEHARRQAEMAAEQLRLALQAAPAAMIMVDQRGTIVLVNALTEQLFGYARHEIVGQSIERLVPSRFRDRHPEYRKDFFIESQQRPMGAGRDLYALRKDGSEVPVEIGLSPLDLADGRFVLAAVSDITERKRTAAVLEDAVRARDDFLSIASHELRNPINALQLRLISVLRALQREADPISGDWLRDRIGQANVQVGRLSRLVDNLLDVSRITAGSIGLEPEDVDCREVVKAVIDQFGSELKPGQLSLHLPRAAVAGHWDRLRLEQVVTNLLSNAIKYGEGKPIDISLAGDGATVRLSVTDQGIGMDEEQQKRLFGRFERVGSGLHYGGLGLGLWITGQIVEAMHGHISVESRPGQGATFSVVIPVRPLPAAPEKAMAESASEGVSARETT